MEVRKGFVFTLDAIFAILIVAAVLINSYSLFAYSPKINAVLDRYAVDILFVLDENGTIASLSNESINNTIASLIPKGVSYTYNITYFNVSVSELVQDRTFYFSNISSDDDLIIDVRAVPILKIESGVTTLNLTQTARAKLGLSI